jgi:hypothetical protein
MLLPVSVSVGVSRAYACSCVSASSSVFNRIGAADAAFAGVPSGKRLDRTERGDGEYRPPVVWKVKVTSVAHGEAKPGDIIEIRTGEGSGDCGTDFAADEERGFLASASQQGFLSIGICSGSVSVDDVRGYRADMPLPTGVGPVAAVVSARWGPATLVAVDANDRPLAYGFGRYVHDRLADCADGSSFAALTYGERGRRVERWDVKTMTIVMGADLRPSDFSFDRVSCNGETIEVAGVESGATVNPDGTISYDTVARPALPTPIELGPGLTVVARDLDDTLARSYDNLERAFLRIKPDGTRVDVLPDAWGLSNAFLRLGTPIEVANPPVLTPPAVSAVTTTTVATTAAPTVSSSTVAPPAVAIEPDSGGGATWLAPAAGAAGFSALVGTGLVVRRRRRSVD